MASIMDPRIVRHAVWREDFMPAHFRNARFHVEANAKESGRRIVTHQFPKKELPYAEDMGRRAFEFTVRGYIITYPSDQQVGNAQDLRKKDYRLARDILINALETEGYGDLQLPTFIKATKVVCTRYRITEENKSGGYCVFDMSFTEFGIPPSQERPNANAQLQAKAEAMRQMEEQRVEVFIKLEQEREAKRLGLANMPTDL